MLLIVREIGSGGFIYLLLLLFIYLDFFFGGNEVNHPGFETFSKGFFLCLSTWTTGDPDVVCGK